ncbi:hypothetical protein [Listeria seeligeri]|uniref:hypothetical protein n=1 Tax=Listeria seeligeri TaxID=1640 RepID=UPI0022EA5261|nr:hypothetical protein [Listeria seeligeri]
MELEKEDCLYCSGEMIARVKGIPSYKPMISGYDSYTFIRYQSIQLTTVDDSGSMSMPINFCPMCGRKMHGSI